MSQSNLKVEKDGTLVQCESPTTCTPQIETLSASVVDSKLPKFVTSVREDNKLLFLKMEELIKEMRVLQGSVSKLAQMQAVPVGAKNTVDATMEKASDQDGNDDAVVELVPADENEP